MQPPSQTIDERGRPVAIEAVFYRHHAVYSHDADSVEEAVAYLNSGEDYGELASVGVFIDGEPRLTDQYVTEGGRSPSEEEAVKMRKDYAKVRR